MTRSRTARALVAVVTVAITAALVAPAAGAKEAPDGYTTTAIKGAGVTVAVPDSWLKIDPTSQSATDALQAAADKNPQLSGLVSQFQLIRKNIEYWVIDTGATKFATNLLVLPTSFDTATLKQPATVKQTLQASLGSNIESLKVKKMKVDGTPALEADATIPLTTVDGASTTAYATIFLVPTKKGVIDFDYTATVPPASDETLAAIVKSIDVR